MGLEALGGQRLIVSVCWGGRYQWGGHGGEGNRRDDRCGGLGGELTHHVRVTRLLEYGYEILRRGFLDVLISDLLGGGVGGFLISARNATCSNVHAHRSDGS